MKGIIAFSGSFIVNVEQEWSPIKEVRNSVAASVLGILTGVIYVSSIQLKHEAVARKLLFEVTHEDLSNLFLRNVLSQLFLAKYFPKHR